MPETETVRDSANGKKVLSADGECYLLSYAYDNPVLDYPTIRCGNARFVLAVDREELAEAYEDAARKAMDTGDHTAGPLAGVDAIIGRLGLREVEAVGRIHDNGVGDPSYYFYAGTVDEGNYRTVDAYDIDDVAILKPSPTSKGE